MSHRSVFSYTGLFSRKLLLPLLLMVGTLAVSISIWLWLEGKDRLRVRTITRVTAEQLSLRLQAWVDSRIQVMQYLAESVPPVTGSEEAYRAAALAILADYGGFQAMNWIDDHHVIRVIVPREGNETALGKDLFAHPFPQVRETIQEVIRRNRLLRTPRIELLQGGAGFATYLPIRDSQGKLLGFVNGVFRINDLVNTCFAEPELRKNFDFRFRESGGEVIYSHGPERDGRSDRFLQRVEVRVVDKPWTLEIAPSPVYLASLESVGGKVFLAGGILGALLLFLLSRMVLTRQQELVASEKRYRLLFEGSRDPIYLSTLEGRFLAVNPAMVDLFGFTREELLQVDIAALYENPEDRRLFLREVLEKRHIVDHEVVLKKKDGGKIICQITASLRVAFDGKVIGIQGIIRDITEKRELEQQLIQAQKLEAIGRLAGGIAHDFNNLLTAIMGNASLAMMHLPPGNPLEKNLKEISKTVERASALTRQLLAFSRKQIIDPKNMNLNRTLEKMREMLVSISGEDIRLEMDLDPELGVVYMDPSQIEQVVLNLVVNARDSMQEGGSLTIRTANVTPGGEEIGSLAGEGVRDWVLLSVSDTGCGISEEIRPRIFEPFFTTKDETRGTGLGLSTVYGIIRQNGGTITVESAVDRGTTFKIYLPRVEESAADPGKIPESELPSGKGESVLVVEDDDAVREMTADTLRVLGYRVTAAENAEKALGLFEERDGGFDLVLSDVVMPGMNGPKMVAAILEKNPDMKILYMSGYAENTIMKHGVPKQGMHFLSKPFRSGELAAKVREILDS